MSFFLFPGQGGQTPAMGRAPAVQGVGKFEEAEALNALNAPQSR